MLAFEAAFPSFLVQRFSEVLWNPTRGHMTSHPVAPLPLAKLNTQQPHVPPLPAPAQPLQPSEHQPRGHRSRDRLDEQDPPIPRRQPPHDARDAHAPQEEQADLRRERRVGVRDAPGEAGGQEAVVQALVGGEGLGLGGELGGGAEGAARAGGRPQEGLEVEDVAVQGGHEPRGGGGDDGVHGHSGW